MDISKLNYASLRTKDSWVCWWEDNYNDNVIVSLEFRSILNTTQGILHIGSRWINIHQIHKVGLTPDKDYFMVEFRDGSDIIISLQEGHQLNSYLTEQTNKES